MVAAGDIGGHLVVVQVEHLLASPAGSFTIVGGEVHLDRGVGEHHRADVPALDHRGPVGRQPFPLTENHLGPHLRVGGHRAHGPRHLGVADLDGGVDPVDRHGPVDGQVHGPGQLGHRNGVGRVDSPPDGREGHGAVHGARVEVGQAEPLGDSAGHRGLS